MLSAAIVAMGLGAVPASAEVLCRKGDSMRLVLRAERCRPRERVVEPSALGVGPGETCIEAIDRVWRDIAVLRAQLEGTRDFAERLAAQPWEGGEIWLALQGLALADTLGRLAEHLEVLGAVETRAVVAQLRQLVSEEWARLADACAEALALLPALEAALPVPPAA
jgi:hypothetical protein